MEIAIIVAIFAKTKNKLTKPIPINSSKKLD